MVKIGDASFDEFIKGLFPNLENDLKLAQMKDSVMSYLKKCFVFSLIVSLNLVVIIGIVLFKYKLSLYIVPVFYILSLGVFYIALKLPKMNQEKIRQEIESDVFVPGRMLLTLLEAGNSIVTALVGVSNTKANSSKYFGRIASEIYLGKNIDEAISEAIKYTPSESFRRILEPIKNSLRTGSDIESNLLATLQSLSKEKFIQVEEYEKKLSPISMFYMIFGAILPSIFVVIVVILISLLGMEVEFFPFLFMLILLIIVIQIGFISLFRKTRPLVKL